MIFLHDFICFFHKTTRDASHFIYYGCYGLKLVVAVSVKTWFEGKSFFKRFFVWFNVYCKYDLKLNYLCLAKCVLSKLWFQLSHETWFHCHFFYLFMYFWPLIWFNLVRSFFYHFLLSVFFKFFYCFVFWFTLFYFSFYFFYFYLFFCYFISLFYSFFCVISMAVLNRHKYH